MTNMTYTKGGKHRDLKPIPPEKVDEWILANATWLSEWLNMVVTVQSEKQMAGQNKPIFQTFKNFLPRNDLNSIRDGIAYLQYTLIKTAVFGVKQEGIKHANGLTWVTPPCFSGFLERYGRMPIEGDHAQFTATEWMLLKLEMPHQFSAQPSPVLCVHTYVDFLLNPNVAQG